MSLSAPTVHRAVVGAFATGAISGAMLFGGAAIAVADPPPNCTAADLAHVGIRCFGCHGGLHVRPPRCQRFLHRS